MNKKLVIFGCGDIAELALYYFSKDSEYEVVAFTVDNEYLTDEKFCELPVVAFENLSEHYPPADYKLFIAVSYSGLNGVREEKYEAGLKRGYSFASYISSYATVLSDRIGDNCFILEDNTIQPFVSIGNNVTLWSGNHIGHHSRIEDHCFITSHVVISGGVVVNKNSFIGVNSTLRDHIKIGVANLIGAGSIIMNDTEDFEVYVPEKTSPRKIRSDKLKRI
ncbi:acetyltransferase [Marinobacterium maritimum]|uniref:Acetyltransferase n=1 Tax=Marinobacterium maritimum TaxID=500162 RepID=A0ABN1I4X7_9GAMM